MDMQLINHVLYCQYSPAELEAFSNSPHARTQLVTNILESFSLLTPKYFMDPKNIDEIQKQIRLLASLLRLHQKQLAGHHKYVKPNGMPRIPGK